MMRAQSALRGLALLILAALAAAAPAQTQPPRAPSLPGAQKEPQYPFNDTDQVRGVLGKIRSQYFVGEPIVVPMTLANHTRFPIVVKTNFNPRSMLKVTIHPSNQIPRRYNGPYARGEYGPIEISLQPLDEFKTKLVIWGDIETPTGLALPEPGNYSIDIELRVAVTGGLEGAIPLGRVFLTITPPPEKLAPFIEVMKQDKAAVYLQLRKNPAPWGEKTAHYLQRNSPSVFTPYLSMSLADYYVIEYLRDKENQQAANEALKYYQQAALSDSAYQFETQINLIEFSDTLDQPKMAAAFARKAVAMAPPDKLGRIGDVKLIKKYLRNTDELDLAKSWAMLP